MKFLFILIKTVCFWKLQKFEVYNTFIISTAWLLIFNIGFVEYRAVYGFTKGQKCLIDANYVSYVGLAIGIF